MTGKYRGRYRIASTRLLTPERSDGGQARLQFWDYSAAGYYFVTICTKNRICNLGRIRNGKMILSPQGVIVQQCWDDLSNHYRDCQTDEFVIMPNHVHGIIVINDAKSDDPIAPVSTIQSVETGFKPVSTTDRDDQIKLKRHHSLSEIVRGFKTFSARRINEYQNTTGRPVWQSRFYEHIIRDETSLNDVRRYILYNPLQWDWDRNNLTQP